MAEITSHPLFGYTAVDNVETGVIGLTAEGADGATTIGDIQGYVFRKAGIQKDILTNLGFSKALSSPVNYMAAKNADLVLIGKRLAKYFQTEYERLLSTGIDDVSARKKAVESMNHMKEKEMKNHEEKFPPSMNEALIRKYEKNLI